MNNFTTPLQLNALFKTLERTLNHKKIRRLLARSNTTVGIAVKNLEISPSDLKTSDLKPNVSAEDNEATKDITKNARLLQALVDAYNTKMNESAMSESVENTVEQTAQALANMIRTSKDELSVYHKEVESLEDAIRKQFDALANQDPEYLALRNIPDLDSATLPTLNWDKLFAIGSAASIKERVEGNTPIATNSSLTSQILTYALKAFNMIRLLKPITLPASVIKEIVDSICDTSSDHSFSADDITPVVKSFLSGSFNKNAASVLKVQQPALMSRWIVDNMDRWEFVATGLSVAPVIDTLASATIPIIKARAEMLDQILSILAYIGILSRKLYKDIVLLPTVEINADTFDAFKANSGSIGMLLKIIKQQYGKSYSKLFPSNKSNPYDTTNRMFLVGIGLSLDWLTNTGQNVVELYQQSVMKSKTLSEMTEHQYLRQAIRIVLTQYIVNIKDTKNDVLSLETSFGNAQTLINTVERDVTVDSVSLEDALYKYFFIIFKINPIAQMLYESIGLKTMKQFNQLKNISENTIIAIHISVIVKICCKILVLQNFIKTNDA